MHDRCMYSSRLALFIHGIHQPRECMKFGQWYMSDKVALGFNVFARYRHQILHIHANFQVLERLYWALNLLVITP